MQTTQLEGNISLMFQENFFEISEKDLKALWDICPKERHEIKIMGKMIKIPRFQTAFGKSYKYSGSVMKGEETPEIVQKIAEKIQKELFPEIVFNNVLANWYTDGTQYIGFHADNTKPFKDGTPVVGVTFCEGKSRKLVIKKKKGRKTVTSVKLTHGSCYVMEGSDFQKKYLHGLPKQKQAGKRLSFTFRCFK